MNEHECDGCGQVKMCRHHQSSKEGFPGGWWCEECDKFMQDMHGEENENEG